MEQLSIENGALYTITPDQARSRRYQAALREEIAVSKELDLERLKKMRINHPEILAYKARVLGNRPETSDYADWTSFLLTDYGSQERCLTLGSGLGRVEKFLISIGFCKSFHAIELSPIAIDKAQEYEPNIEAECQDLNFLQLEPNSYDFILCHGVLHHLINVEHVLFQLNLALKSDGVLLIYEYVGATRWRFSKDVVATLRAILPGIGIGRSRYWKSYIGFESIRSGDLLTLIKAQFSGACERAVTYGGVYFPFLRCTKPEADVYMKQVVRQDERLSKEQLLPPCYHMGIYRKSPAPPIIPSPWSDKELKERLQTVVPIDLKIMRMLKRGPIVPILAKARHLISEKQK